MRITPLIWMEVAGIKCEGLKVEKDNITTLENFNKVHFFRSCLSNPRAAMRGFHVGGLTMNPRIITFIIVWIITPREHNHVVLHEKDLILMYCILNQLEVNWTYVLGEQMMKSKRLVDYRIPYMVLVLKFIEYFVCHLMENCLNLSSKIMIIVPLVFFKALH